MFNKNKPNPELQDLIDRQIESLKYESDPEEYDRRLAQLEKLTELQAGNRDRRVSPDVRAQVIANLAGIAIIVGHERASIVTSKALNFVRKLF